MMDELKKRNSLLDLAISQTERQVQKQYIKIAKDLELKLRVLYQNIQDDGEPLLSHLYQYNRYYDLLNTIQNDLVKLGQYEKRVLEDNLTKLYIDNANIISNYGNNFKPFINEARVREIIKENWGGRAKNWSDSIWGSTKEIAERIRTDMVDIITTGKSYKEISLAISKDFGVKYHEAQRLIRTEMARTSIESTINSYTQAGIQKVRVITAEDERTCDECVSHDGAIIPLLEVQVGINVPPFHPNCRCDIVAVWEE